MPVTRRLCVSFLSLSRYLAFLTWLGFLFSLAGGLAPGGQGLPEGEGAYPAEGEHVEEEEGQGEPLLLGDGDEAADEGVGGEGEFAERGPVDAELVVVFVPGALLAFEAEFGGAAEFAT